MVTIGNLFAMKAIEGAEYGPLMFELWKKTGSVSHENRGPLGAAAAPHRDGLASVEVSSATAHATSRRGLAGGAGGGPTDAYVPGPPRVRGSAIPPLAEPSMCAQCAAASPACQSVTEVGAWPSCHACQHSWCQQGNALVALHLINPHGCHKARRAFWGMHPHIGRGPKQIFMKRPPFSKLPSQQTPAA